ncbi:MAG: lactoylglutathione lyase [Nitratireductor sp.]|nr:lactoylglutathione lyase [Nitratireductor sp.]
MEFHRGRLIDHVHLRVSDLEKSRAFYRAVLVAIGRELTHETDTFFVSDELFVDQADTYVSRVHIAFQATGPDMVKRFHEAGIANGGADNGAPGERSYHPGYYGAYILDPDGNNIEAVWHGPARRSAESVTITAS